MKFYLKERHNTLIGLNYILQDEIFFRKFYLFLKQTNLLE